MPGPKRLSICLEPGCADLVRGGGRCERHRREHAALIAAAGEVAAWRNVPWRWVYSDPRWRALKRQVRSEQLLCAEPGCLAHTHDVDHIVSLADGGAPFDRANVQGLCKRHHSRKTAAEVRRRNTH